MESTKRKSDVPLVVGGVLALLAAGGIIYATVDAGIMDETRDTNSPNGTTGGPPASFEGR
jgi:hypothetical protein